MVLEITNKILVVLYVLSCLTVIRHSYYLLQSFAYSTEEQPLKYKLRPIQLLWLGLSFSFIISSIFIGIRL